MADASKVDLTGVRVIVTDAEERLGLYVIRALGRAGCRVTALSRRRTRPVLGFKSRFATEHVRLREGPYREVLAETLVELSSRHDVVVPVTTLSILSVGLSESILRPHIRYFIPPLDSVRIAESKRDTGAVAAEVDVPIPATYNDLGPDDIGEWARAREPFHPLVVKFADDRRSGGWSPADRYSIVRTREELVSEYLRMHEVGEYPVVQDYIEGDGYGFFTIMDPESEPAAVFCHRRLREYPISGGPSTLCESVHDPELIELGTRLLQALDWQGVAMAEFKRDRHTGEYRLLEINPRFWGSLPLALQCGVNFPAYQVQLALGVEPSAPESYPVGRKMRYFFSDLLAVRNHWRSGDRGIATTYLRELFDPRIRDGLFDLSDPLPMVAYLKEVLGR